MSMVSSGHVFVVRGDLTRIACDAWLLPSNEVRGVADYWLKALPGVVRIAVEAVLRDSVVPVDWGSPGHRTHSKRMHYDSYRTRTRTRTRTRDRRDC